MRSALSLGCNKYSPAVYGEAKLNGCVNDAKYMNELAFNNHFDAEMVVDSSAIKAYFTLWMERQAKKAVAGDYILLTWSGHGTNTKANGKDINGICLYDGVLWDYEFKELICKFRKGVSIIWVSDSCFSEENFKFIFRQDGAIKSMNFKNVAIKAPENVSWTTSKDFKCNFIQYASSNKYQVSYDLGQNGLFTDSLRRSVRMNPSGNYYKIFEGIQKIIAQSGYPQTPKFICINGNDVKPKGLTYRQFLL